MAFSPSHSRMFGAQPRELLSEGGVDVQADIKLDTAVVWLKRYAASGRPFNELHTDSSFLAEPFGLLTLGPTSAAGLSIQKVEGGIASTLQQPEL